MVTLKKALIKRFHYIHPVVQLRQLNACTQNRGEDPRDYDARLQTIADDLFSEMFADPTQKAVATSLYETQIKGQYVSGHTGQLCDEAIAIEHQFRHSGRWTLEDKGSCLEDRGQIASRRTQRYRSQSTITMQDKRPNGRQGESNPKQGLKNEKE